MQMELSKQSIIVEICNNRRDEDAGISLLTIPALAINVIDIIIIDGDVSHRSSGNP